MTTNFEGVDLVPLLGAVDVLPLQGAIAGCHCWVPLLGAIAGAIVVCYGWGGG